MTREDATRVASRDPGAPPAAGAMIDEAPLAEAARALASEHALAAPRARAGRIEPRLAALREGIRAVYAVLPHDAAALSSRTQWLLDNDYLILRAVRQVEQDMPQSYYAALPRLRDGAPRAEAVARRVLAWSEGRLDLGEVRRFVEAYQEVTPLTLGEAWALPTFLRIAALDRLLATAPDAREAARPEAEPVEWVPAAILSLHALEKQDWTAFVESISLIERRLREDPAGIYARMDEETRDSYRRAIETLAQHCGYDEAAVAGEAVRLARASVARQDDRTERAHVGTYLVGAAARELERSVSARLPARARLVRWLRGEAKTCYAIATALVAMVPVSVVTVLAVRWGSGTAALALTLTLAIPAWVTAEALLRGFVPRLVPPRRLPKLDLRGGVPGDARTLVAVPALLWRVEDLTELFATIERHHLGHRDSNLAYAILADLPDAPEPVMPGDGELLERAQTELAALRARHPQGRFLLLTRERRWNASEACWMGWERKRGKLAELNRLVLHGERGSFAFPADGPAAFGGFRYVITLDADTVLSPGSAFRLIGTLAHPLNRAAFGADDRLRHGYTVLQPRIEARPDAGEPTRFARLRDAGRNVDLYAHAVSEPYMDLFGEGIYAGKGIYEVAAFERSMRDRAPDNAILSHDLFEGGLGRAGLVSDVVILESQPRLYLAHAARHHRWIRGDWQLLPWLARRLPGPEGRVPNPLSWVSRWVLAQNLVRSLYPPSLLALFAVGWLVLPGAGWATTAFALALSAALVLPGPLNLVRRIVVRGHVARPPTLRGDVLRWLMELAFLPHASWIAVSAVGTSLWRLAVTRRHLLQWRDASRAARDASLRRSVGAHWRAVGVAPLVAAAVAALLIAFRREALPTALPLLLAWTASPQLAFVLDSPLRPLTPALTPQQERWLTAVARRTWLYFERFVGPDDHWLPPDHFQESPRGGIAHRTSPTNIGLLLATTFGAHDFGFLDTRALLQRLGNTFASMDRLERHRGHLLNWYDTRSLRALPPRYVSTVDSGNLLGCLVVVRQACLEVLDQPVLRASRLRGLLTLVDLVEESASPVPGTDDALARRLAATRACVERARTGPDLWAGSIDQLLGQELPDLERHLLARVRATAGGVGHESLADVGIWLGRLSAQLHDMRRGANALLPWLAVEARPAAIEPLLANLPPHVSFNELPAAYQRLRAGLASAGTTADEAESGRRARLSGALDAAERMVAELERDAGAIAAKAEGYLQEARFDFLFDEPRKLFRIGYHVDDDRQDEHAYDLLASEARIGSFLAIALGKVGPEHWLHLGRPTALVDGAQALLSWSGTMFEYLMPSLFMRTPVDTLLGHGCRVAVDRQIAFGGADGMPWGVSESGYARTDAQQNYQYAAFGIPDLALARATTPWRVVAPYASQMALPWAPRAAVRNLERLADAGALGRYGFYEALDYTPEHVAPGERYAVVRSFMAHHHGMGFLALCNVLHGPRFVDRFHADRRVQSSEILLHEGRTPTMPLERIEPDERGAPAPPRIRAAAVEPWAVPVHSLGPQVHALSNGRYTVFLSNAGGGGSRWEGLDLTRWRSDTTCDAWGQWTYLQDLDLARSWSATPQPMDAPGQEQRVLFHPHQVSFQRRDGDVTTRLEVVVAPYDDAEIRRVTLINHGDARRRLAVSNYGEVVLAPHASDLRHPAFGKLFVESRWHDEVNGVSFRRRPRSAREAPAFLLHRLVREDGHDEVPEVETDRERFLGRHGHVGDPRGLRSERWSGSLGATLDPIFALRTYVTIEPHASAQLSFVTLAGRSLHDLLDVARRYGDRDRIDMAFQDARARQSRAAAQLGLEAGELARAGRLLSRLLYPDATLRADSSVLRSNQLGPPGLWAHGISGDHPILLLRVATPEDLMQVPTMLRIHRLWRGQRFTVDLVLLNELDKGYVQTTRDALTRLVGAARDEVWLDRPGGIFMLSAAHLDDATRTLLAAAARVIVGGGTEPAAIREAATLEEVLPAFEPSHVRPDDGPDTPPLPRPTQLRFDNGWGGFSEDGSDYLVYLQERATPSPWINVLANPTFGCLISEAGASTTWSVNSAENRLTPWSNDPVTDPSGEVLYLRDEESAEVWTPTPRPIPGGLPYRVRHGAGHTTFEHRSRGLEQRLQVFVLDDAPLKMVRLRLTNLLARPRRITATYYLEWVLGDTRERGQAFVIPEYDAATGALLARNPYRESFAGQVAFLAADRTPHGLTTDRREFLGRNGSTRAPAALGRIGLSGRVEAGRDPCAALQLHIDLAAGGQDEVVFLIGAGSDREAALASIREHRGPRAAEAAWKRTERAWSDRLGAIRVRTPDPAMDLMLNRWLPYQGLACRLWGRSAFYQSGGAFGFRDQLQDSLALLHAEPAQARAQILNAARHQFQEGDVLHWWHPPEGRGVRTRMSDDLAWLPYVLTHYVEGTGDRAVLDERVPFLVAPELAPHEQERYDRYAASEETHTLFEHACRALDRAVTHGRHGLPLIGGGDWNDGMNRVGGEGRGESVWLAWFLIATLRRFASLCEARGEAARAERHRQHAEAYRIAVETHAWDGDWYLRAFYDDGTPLGSHQGDEARIDAIAQAWAVLSGAADPARAKRAMEAVDERLVRRDDGLVLLLTPPFDRGAHDPGYIKGYPPGVRENGGQYTHAALWVAWAFAQAGDGDRAHELFDLLGPVAHADAPEAAARYRIEPYVVAADVYGVPPHVGRGGWSWYTGSAGWMYRLGVEAILGLRRRGDHLAIEPCIPRDWPAFEVAYRFGGSTFRIRVENPEGVSCGVASMAVDGADLPERQLPLVDDGRDHEVWVRMGGATERPASDASVG